MPNLVINMKTVSQNDILRMSENFRHKLEKVRIPQLESNVVYYATRGLPHFLIVRFGEESMRITEGDDYAEGLDKAQKMSQFIYNAQKNYGNKSLRRHEHKVRTRHYGSAAMPPFRNYNAPLYAKDKPSPERTGQIQERTC